MIIQLLLKLGHFVCKIGVVPILFVGICRYMCNNGLSIYVFQSVMSFGHVQPDINMRSDWQIDSFDWLVFSYLISISVLIINQLV